MQCFSLGKPRNISRAIWFMKFIPCHRTVKLARTFSTNIYLRLIKNWLDEIWTRAKKMVFIWIFIHRRNSLEQLTNRETKLIWLQRGLFVLTNCSKNVLGTLSYGMNLALCTMSSSCFRTLRHLWSVLPLIWFVLVPCSFEISLHSCCIVACTSSPILLCWWDPCVDTRVTLVFWALRSSWSHGLESFLPAIQVVPVWCNLTIFASFSSWEEKLICSSAITPLSIPSVPWQRKSILKQKEI